MNQNSHSNWINKRGLARCPFPHPEPVLQVQRIANLVIVSLLTRATPPLVALRMPVHKSKTAATVVISSRSIRPDRMFHGKGKCRIVETAHVLVHQHPETAWTGRIDAGYFGIGEPRFFVAVRALVVQPRPVHGQVGSAGVWCPRSGVGARVEAGADGAHGLAHGESPCRRDNLASHRRVPTLIPPHAFVARTMKYGNSSF